MKKDFFNNDINFDGLKKKKYSVDEAKERVSAKRNFRGLFK